MHEEYLQCEWSVYFPPTSWIKALTVDCFYFSDQEVKMEEAMSHTGIHQFLFLFSGFFFNTCMGQIASFSLISIRGVLALDLWLHAGDTLTNHHNLFFSPIGAPSCVVFVYNLFFSDMKSAFERAFWASAYKMSPFSLVSTAKGAPAVSSGGAATRQAIKVHVNDNAWKPVSSPIRHPVGQHLCEH